MFRDQLLEDKDECDAINELVLAASNERGHAVDVKGQRPS